MKKTFALILTLCLLMMTAAFGMADTADDSADAAPYVFSVDEQGQTVLTLTAEDGTISWVKQVTE